MKKIFTVIFRRRALATVSRSDTGHRVRSRFFAGNITKSVLVEWIPGEGWYNGYTYYYYEGMAFMKTAPLPVAEARTISLRRTECCISCADVGIYRENKLRAAASGPVSVNTLRTHRS